MNEWPTWAKVAAGLGVPTLFAFWLMTSIGPKVDRTAAAMERHVHDQETAIILLRAICRNTAKTELQGQFCDYGLPEWPR